MGTAKIDRPEIQIKEHATLVITEEFLDQVKYLCNRISQVEWSGLLYFSIEGTPQELSTFKIIPYYIHLMDKGTSAYTEFDDDGSLVELYEEMPELSPFSDEEYRYGKIHSHNSMDVFHSGTDNQDLQDQAGNYAEYYLSVIVNNDLDVDVKMAFVAEIPEQQINPKKFKGAKWELPKKEVLVTVDFDVEFPYLEETTVSKVLKERTDAVIEASKVSTYTPSKWVKGNQGKHHYMGMGLGGFEEDEYATSSHNTFRSDAGKDLFDAFLAVYFDVSRENTELHMLVEELLPSEMEILKKALLVWFGKLPDYSKQNLIMYITDTDTKLGEDNLELLHEAVYNTLRIVEQ